MSLFKNIVASSIPEVMGCAGGEISLAKKEAQVVATLLQTAVRLNFNGNIYLIDAQGNCTEEKSAHQKILDLVKKG